MSTATVPTICIPTGIFLPKALPIELGSLLSALSQPFPLDEIQVLPGAVDSDGTSALALPYAGWWTSYVPRLNTHLGQWNWGIRLEPWGQKAIAHLSAFGGLIQHSGAGESDGGADNEGTSSEIQAKKRVCAEALGLGFFFYSLPKVWGKGERRGKAFHFAKGEAERAVAEMFRKAGLRAAAYPAAAVSSSSREERTPHPVTLPAAPARPALPAPSVPPAPRSAARPTRSTMQQTAPNPRVETGRAVLRAAEAKTAQKPVQRQAMPVRLPATNAASDKQLGYVVSLIEGLLRETDEWAEEIDALGMRLKVSRLSELQTVADLKATGRFWTKSEVSDLIQLLQEMQQAAKAV